jgi:hypothetical protein
VRSWLNLMYHPGSCLEGLKETTKNLIQSRRDFKRERSPPPSCSVVIGRSTLLVQVFWNGVACLAVADRLIVMKKADMGVFTYQLPAFRAVPFITYMLPPGDIRFTIILSLH